MFYCNQQGDGSRKAAGLTFAEDHTFRASPSQDPLHYATTSWTKEKLSGWISVPEGHTQGRLCLKWLTPVNHEIGLGRKKASDWKRRLTWITLSQPITGATSSRKLRREVITQRQGWGRGRCSSHPQQEWGRSSHVLEFLFPCLFADPNCFHAGQMRP